MIAILRGEDIRSLMSDQARCFARLRALASSNGLVIAPSGTPYVNADELAVLAWLARAQRILTAGSAPPPRYLAAVVRQCASALSDNDIRLSSLTFYAQPDQAR